MRTSPAPEPGPGPAAGGPLPLLTGADCFLRAFDAETRRWNGASHLSQLVLRLGPRFDLETFRRVLAEVTRANPILRAPVRRRLGLGPPVYRVDRAPRVPLPPVEVQEVAEPRWRGDGEAELPGLFARRLNEVRSARRGELLRVDAVRYAGGELGTDLAFTWLHLLFDGAGSERFVAFLEQCRRGERAPGDVPGADRPGAPPDARLPAGLRERGAMAMGWKRWRDGLAAQPARSLAGPLRRLRQDLVYDVVRFGAQESARIVERASAHAGFLTPMLFYLAAAIRAHHAVLRKRASEPASYVVPLPVDLRPKGAEGGLFRTRVSMLWFQVPAALADDLGALLAALREQRHRAIRARQVENGVAAMDFARFAPAPLYARMARRPLRGELCSFFFAWTGEFCAGLERFFGARVEAGFHAPAVPPSPGSGLVLSERGGRISCTHVRQRGVLEPAELALFAEQLRRDLTGA
jgi:hypothetical protein